MLITTVLVIIFSVSMILAISCMADTGPAEVSTGPEASGENAGKEVNDKPLVNTEKESGSKEEVEVPENIVSEITSAEDYFMDGMYAEAIDCYRDARILIEESELPSDIIDEILEDINKNYRKALEIVEAARMHHSNAMNLRYEKRFEEAKKELEKSLEIYPGYREALDALDSLESLMDLE